VFDDGDWALWADEFGWDQDDKDGDGNLADPGEWGFIVYNYDGVDTAFFHPSEVMQHEDGFPKYQVSGVGSDIYNMHGLGYETAGVDEWIEFGALREIENVEGATSITGEDLPIGVTSAPYHLVLSPMNYGEVWMQGLDISLTHFLTENIIIDGNVSWYGTPEFYNELTKKKDPINAPKWKWNASVKGKSSLGDFIINFRHVDRFVWSDGIWAGVIGPYNIIDLFYTYHITENLDLNLSALNLNNDLHKELVGGAIMGRQVVMNLFIKMLM
jgi:outer membrane receptor protein involved in Fe transport